MKPGSLDLKIILPIFVLLSCIIVAPAVAASASDTRYVVVPFSNDTGEESLYWMGEALAIGLTDHLLSSGLDVVEPDRRRDALMEMGLDSSEPVTLASAILLGRRLGAELIILGSYDLLPDHGVLLVARTVNDPQTLEGPRAEVRGSLSDLHRLQQKLIAELTPGSHSRTGSASLMKTVEQIPLSSLEMYARAVSTDDPDERRDLLARALESDPLFAAALIQRAQLEIDEGRPESAFLWLDRIQMDHLLFPERYWLVRGDAAAAAGDRGSAVDHYQQSLSLRPRAVTHFHLAAVLAKQGKLMDARQQVDAGLILDPQDPDGIELREALAHDREPAA
jgi:Tfp pilus assembly protein PilF